MITPEFRRAVKERNLLRIRIMMKDSLLIDKSADLFNEMNKYAKNQGIYVWTKNGKEFDVLPEDSWDESLLNSELVKLINDFTIKRVSYCLDIIRKIYKDKNKEKSNVKGQSKNDQEYREILKEEEQIRKILKRNKNGKRRTWKDEDIKQIYGSAKNIQKACKIVLKNLKGENKDGNYK